MSEASCFHTLREGGVDASWLPASSRAWFPASTSCCRR